MIPCTIRPSARGTSYVKRVGCVVWKHQCKHPLEVAVEVRNRPATVMLVELGAPDFTDFRSIDPYESGHIRFDKSGPDGHPGSPPAMAAFDKQCRITWPSHDQVHAQIASAIMKRQIAQRLSAASREMPTSAPTLSRPRRTLAV